MSRVERIESLLRQIEDETRVAFDEHTQLYRRTQGLESENEKLREFCAGMASHLREAERIHGDKLLPDGYIARMRELGIEVKQ